MLNLIEKSFVVLVLLYFTQAFDHLLSPDAVTAFGDPTQSSSTGFVIQALIYTIAALFIGLRWKATLNSIKRCRWAVALSILALASTFWSAAPDLTARRSLVLLATTLFGLYFGRRYSLGQQL